MNKTEARSRATEDWSNCTINDPKCLSLIQNIINYTWDKVGQRIDSKELFQFESSLPDLLKALQYLSLDRIPLLEVRAELQDQGEVYEVSEQISAALVKGTLTHPLTMEEIEDYERKVFIYFIVRPIEKL